MKQLLLVATLTLSSSTVTAPPGSVWWAVFGPLEVSTMTSTSVGLSTGAITNVILKSATTPDCYILTVTPNGTIGTKWIQCPK